MCATLLHFSVGDVCLLVHAEAGYWNLGSVDRNQRKDLIWLCKESSKGLEYDQGTTAGTHSTEHRSAIGATLWPCSCWDVTSWQSALGLYICWGRSLHSGPSLALPQHRWVQKQSQQQGILLAHTENGGSHHSRHRHWHVNVSVDTPWDMWYATAYHMPQLLYSESTSIRALRARLGGLYSSNWGTDSVPNKSVTATEQRGNPAQHPVQVLVTTTPKHIPLIKGETSNTFKGKTFEAFLPKIALASKYWTHKV